MSWAASGMSMMPGLAPRPQHHIVQKTDFNEKVESSSNAMFISVRECKGGVINVLGKTGKISLEKSKGIKLCLDSRVVGGVLEIIKCEDVYIQLVKDGEVPTFQIDDSSKVSIEICTRSQIECIYYIRCQELKLILTTDQSAELDGKEEAALQYEVPTEQDRANVQQIAHWSAATVDAVFLSEGVVRDGVYPTTAEMKKAAEAKKQQMIAVLNSVKPGELTEAAGPELSEKDKNLDIPD